MKRTRVDVNLEELDQMLDHAREAPLSEPESEKLKDALHALAGMLPRTTHDGKDQAVFGQTDPPTQQCQRKTQRPRAQRSFLLHRRQESCGSASHVARRRSLPGLRKRQSLSAERTADAGAHRGTSAAGRNRV